jgi:hypothetical protein
MPGRLDSLGAVPHAVLTHPSRLKAAELGAVCGPFSTARADRHIIVQSLQQSS